MKRIARLVVAASAVAAVVLPATAAQAGACAPWAGDICAVVSLACTTVADATHDAIACQLA